MFVLGMDLSAQEDRHQGRGQSHRHNRGEEHRKGLGVSQRRKHLACLSREGENRQEADSDDQLGEEN